MATSEKILIRIWVVNVSNNLIIYTNDKIAVIKANSDGKLKVKVE